MDKDNENPTGKATRDPLKGSAEWPSAEQCATGPGPATTAGYEALRGHRANRLTIDECYRPTLRDRVEKACGYGEVQAGNYARAKRAATLIERYPEVAELIELLREF